MTMSDNWPGIEKDDKMYSKYKLGYDDHRC